MMRYFVLPRKKILLLVSELGKVFQFEAELETLEPCPLFGDSYGSEKHNLIAVAWKPKGLSCLNVQNTGETPFERRKTLSFWKSDNKIHVGLLN